VIDRRAFLATVGAAITVAPPAGEAQQPRKVYRIGVITSGINPRSASFFQVFERQLRDHGWVERTNLAIDYRTPSGPTLRVAEYRTNRLITKSARRRLLAPATVNRECAFCDPSCAERSSGTS